MSTVAFANLIRNTISHTDVQSEEEYLLSQQDIPASVEDHVLILQSQKAVKKDSLYHFDISNGSSLI